MEENRIEKMTETAGKPAVWDRAPFFIKLCVLFSAFYVFCLYDNPAGITYPLFTAGFLGLYVYFLKKEKQDLKKDSVFYMTAVFLLGLSNCLTDNQMIILFNKTGSFLLYAVLFVHNACRDEEWNVIKYTGSLLRFGLSVIESLPGVFITAAQMRTVKRTASSHSEKNRKESKTIYVILGILIGILLLFIILPLLVSADPVFEYIFEYIFHEIFDAVFQQIVLPKHLLGILLMFFWGILLFFALFLAIRKKKIKEEQREMKVLEPVLAVSFLSVIGIVYLVFCLVQISYLFTGGMELPSGYTYSGFAREGFFQLLFVSILNLGIVLFCLELFRNHRVLKLLLTFLSGCTYIMLFSSACRMYLYIQAYGLSRLRVLVLAALLVISIVLGGMICSIYRERFPLFRFTVAVVTVVYVILSLGRMDVWIAKYNISLKGFDITYENTYLLTLSADAAGVYADAAKEGLLQTETADNLLKYYFEKYEKKYEAAGLRKFNLSQCLAAKAAERYQQTLKQEIR